MVGCANKPPGATSGRINAASGATYHRFEAARSVCRCIVFPFPHSCCATNVVMGRLAGRALAHSLRFRARDRYHSRRRDMTAAVPLSIAPREDQLFPVLTPAQIARVAKRGEPLTVQAGDVLIEAGQPEYPFFVVLDGEIEVVRASCDGEQIVATHRQGQFSGEINMLAGRRSLATIRASRSGEVIELKRDALLALVQTDAELSEIFMRAFILRRALLLDKGFGDVLVLGSSFSPRTLE